MREAKRSEVMARVAAARATQALAEAEGATSSSGQRKLNIDDLLSEVRESTEKVYACSEGPNG